MAVKSWQGDASPVDQIDRISITVANSFAYTVTIGGSTVTYTSTATATKLDIANGLIAAIQSETASGQFRLVRAELEEPSTGNYVVDVSSRAPGEPFTMSVGTNLSASTTQAATGPNDCANVANWGGALPEDGDTLIFRDTSASLLWNLDELTGLGFANVYFDATFTGRVGLPAFNATNPAATFAEYRTTHFECAASAVTVGRGSGEGSQLIRLNLASTQCDLAVLQTGTPDGNYAAFQVIGSAAGSTLAATRGSIDVAWQEGEAATLATVTTSYDETPADDVKLRIGSGATVGTIVSAGGRIEVDCNTTSITASDGLVICNGSSAHTAIGLSLNAGLDYRSTGTIGALTAGEQTVADFTGLPAARTVSTATLRSGAAIRDRAKSVTWTAGIVLSGCGVDDVTLDLGKSITVSVS